MRGCFKGFVIYVVRYALPRPLLNVGSIDMKLIKDIERATEEPASNRLSLCVAFGIIATVLMVANA
jgi:hypothetical protein